MDQLNATISQCHEHLGELFQLHQECLLERQLPEALLVLRLFEDKHRYHMQFEDRELLPRYVDMDEPGRWGAKIYTAEHSKIAQLLDKLLTRVTAMEQQADIKRSDIIDLLDQEKTFKNVCEHHELREEECLLMQLDQRLDIAVKNELAWEFENGWRMLCAEQADELERVRDGLGADGFDLSR